MCGQPRDNIQPGLNIEGLPSRSVGQDLDQTWTGYISLITAILFLQVLFSSASQADPHFPCKNCGNLLALVSQIYCPLDGSKYHRLLLIYACISRSCWNKSNSWLAIRKQFVDDKAERCGSAGDSFVPKEEWLDAEDDWSDGEDKCCDVNGSPWNSIVAECSMETANLSLTDVRVPFFSPDIRNRVFFQELQLKIFRRYRRPIRPAINPAWKTSLLKRA